MSLPIFTDRGHKRRRGRRRSRPGGTTALIALLAAVLTGLLGQTGSAYALAPNPTTTASPQATGPKSTPKATPQPAPKPAGPSAPKVDAKAVRAAAAAKAISASDLPDTCSGAIQPDTVYPCASVDSGSTSTFTLNLPQATDLVFIQTVTTGGGFLQSTLKAPDGSTVTCQQPDWAKPLKCGTSQPGSYSLEIVNGTGAGTGFSLAYTALLSDTSCTAVGGSGLHLGAPADLPGVLPAGAAGKCYSPDLAAGDVLRSFITPYPVTEAVYDATGAQVCTGSTDCTLTGKAPFRVLASQPYAAAADYHLTLARLSDPEGCPTLEPQAYGTVPERTPNARCRALHVPTAGTYRFSPVISDAPGALYKADATFACAQNYLTTCPLAAGTYFWVVNSAYADDAGPFGMSFNDINESRGCTAVKDDGFTSGPATGAFSGPGEQICLTLPTSTGRTVFMVNQPPADGADPNVVVLDANGTEECQNYTYTFVACALHGTAPFRAVLSGPSTGTYALAVQRTDTVAGCASWPQSGFGGSWGAEASLTATKQVQCLSIPAGQHSTNEMIDYENTANTVNAAITFYDPSGKKICSTVGSTTICPMVSGTSYTAVLTGTGWADTYHLVRRDISRTASCTAPVSTTVGGQSTAFTLGSALDARCLRVPASSVDKLWMGARTTAPAPAGAVLEVVDSSGTFVCRQWGVSCQVTGDTSYVVLVLASDYKGTPITAHVDTWRVGTASGWAPECTAHPVSMDGFSLRSGTFTENATGYCAVAQVKPSQSLGVYGTYNTEGADQPSVELFNAAHWGESTHQYQCLNTNAGDFSYRCSVSSQGEAAQAVLLVTPSSQALPMEYSVQGVCLEGCSTKPPTKTLTSITPATGPAGTQNQVVVHGTGLDLSDELTLTTNAGPASDYRMSEPVSVSPDGTTLTLRLSTHDVAPGTYDVVLDNMGWSAGMPASGVLSGAYTVTAAPITSHNRFVPVTPERFLDTRNGTGAPKARVGAGGVVQLQVAGVKSLPATGVTAVVMNVTAVNPSQGGFVTVYPDGRPLPAVSNIGFRPGQTIPNLVTVPVVNGKVDLRNATGSVDLLADVTGYYTEGTGSALTAITPTRFLDTRNGTGAAKAPVGAGGVVRLQVAGVKGVPATGVTAVVMNVTVTGPTQPGFVTVYPDGAPVPAVSNLNFAAKETIPNLVVVPVVNGKVDLRNVGGSVDLLADVTGYFSSTGSTFTPAGPTRLMDTRSGLGARAGAVGPGGTVSLRVADMAGVPTEGVTAVVLNVTVTGPTTGGFLTVYPHGRSMPGVSNLNFTTGETIANLVVVPVVDGQVTFYNMAGDVQVIADLNGYYSS